MNKYDQIINEFSCQAYDIQYNLLIDENNSITFMRLDTIYTTEENIDLKDLPNWVQKHFITTLKNKGIIW